MHKQVKSISCNSKELHDERYTNMQIYKYEVCHQKAVRKRHPWTMCDILFKFTVAEIDPSL